MIDGMTEEEFGEYLEGLHKAEIEAEEFDPSKYYDIDPRDLHSMSDDLPVEEWGNVISDDLPF